MNIASHSFDSGRLYWATYLGSFRDLRVSKNDKFATCYHQVRDGLPMVHLLFPLIACGYRWGGPLFNFPHKQPPKEATSTLPDMSGNDLLALVTSPPMTFNQRRPVYRSFNPEEERVLRSLQTEFLSACSPSCVTLVDAIAQSVPAPFRNRKSIHFYQYKSGAYAHGWKKKHIPDHLGRMLTAGYLFYAPEIWSGGPRLLVVFGTSGVDTLTWTYLLANRYAPILVDILSCSERRFLFVEWEKVPLPQPRAFARKGGDLAFLDASREHVLLDLAAPARGAPQWSVRDCRRMGERQEEFVTWKPARSATVREPEPAF